MPTLADIYSAMNTAQRKGGDFIRNPGASLQQILGYANDRARDFNQLNDQALAEMEQTGKLTGPAGQQLMQTMSEAYNPVGMIIPAFHGTNIPKIAAPGTKLSEMYDRTHFPGWFSENPELANYYAIARGEGNPSVIPVNLNIKKPLKLNFDMNDRAESAIDAVKKLGLDVDFYPELRDKKWAHEIVNTYTFKKAAQEAGYDAIQVMEDGYKTYAPLKESGKQVRSRYE